MSKKYLKGSYTLEATLIMPMILSILVLLIYWAFYLHDRAILSAAAYTAALRGSQMISGENISDEVNKCSKDLINNRLLITKGIEQRVEVKGDTIAVSYEGSINIPDGVLLNRSFAAGAGGIPVSAKGSAKKNDAVKFINSCRFIEHTLNKGK